MEWLNNWWVGLNFFEQVMYLIAIPSSLLLLIQTVMLAIGAAGATSGDFSNPSDTSGLDLHTDFDGSGDFDVGGHFDGGGDFDASGHFGGDFDASGHFGGDFDASGHFDGGDFDGSGHFDGGDTHGGHIHHGDGSGPREFNIASMFTMQGITSFFCVFGWMGALMSGSGVLAPLAAFIGLALGFLAMYGIAQLMRHSAKLAHNGSLNVNNLLGENGTVYLKIPPKGQGQGKVMVQTSERLVEFEAVSEEETEIPDNARIRVVDILGGNILVVERENV